MDRLNLLTLLYSLRSLLKNNAVNEAKELIDEIIKEAEKEE